MDKLILGEFQMTGINTIDIDFVANKWSHLWGIYQWDESYRLIKSLRKDSPITTVKITISINQAKKIIEKLHLKPLKGGFKGATTWKRQEDWDAMYSN